MSMLSKLYVKLLSLQGKKKKKPTPQNKPNQPTKKQKINYPTLPRKKQNKNHNKPIVEYDSKIIPW